MPEQRLTSTTIKNIAKSGDFYLNSPLLRALSWKYWHLERDSETKDPENLKRRLVAEILNRRKNETVFYMTHIREQVRKSVDGLLLLRALTGFYMWKQKGLVHPSFKWEIVKTRIRHGRTRKVFASGSVIIEEFVHDLFERLVDTSRFQLVLTDQTIPKVDFVLYDSLRNRWTKGFQVKEYVYCYRPTGQEWEQYMLNRNLMASALVEVGQRLKSKFPTKKAFLVTPELQTYGKWKPYLAKLKESWAGVIYFWRRHYPPSGDPVFHVGPYNYNLVRY